MRASSPQVAVPAIRGYRMQAEWEPHAATWLTWPHDEAHWPEKFHLVPDLWAQMVRELERGEEVHILIHDDATRVAADQAMSKAGVVGRNVRLHSVANNFPWMRDHGPIFLRSGKGDVLATHWRYNAWGGKWRHDLDAKIPERVADLAGVERIDVPMVLEGGSIDTNGGGLLLTTESCLLNKNRNPEYKKDVIESYLKKYLGMEKILWLTGEVAGDDTDGHVDDLARFVAPGTVFAQIERNKSDANYEALAENVRRLAKMTDVTSRPLQVTEVPLPAPVIYEDVRLPASYANFYIGNEVVLVPVFKDPNDQRAVDTLERAFPGRRVVPIDARDLIWGMGAFHCVTQQQPKGG